MENSENHHLIFHIQINLGTKLQSQLKILKF